MSKTSNLASRTLALVGFWSFVGLVMNATACDGDENSHSQNSAGGNAGTGASGGTGAASGSSGVGASAGTAGRSNFFVDQLVHGDVDKIDLLFMIDNSRSMADKQQILRDAVPVLLDRLVNPLCLNPATGALSQPVGGQCLAPLEREFNAIDDIHIGIVTSSLGGHGADTCSPASGRQFDPTQDDKAQLLPSVRQNLPQYNGAGFLVWDPSRKHVPPGEGSSSTLVQQFQQQVVAVGEVGCGFESSLEAWYRFLIDPDPPSEVVVQNGEAIVQRPNSVVLQQRAQFLRPDSAVAVIMLTDENDCSIFDGGIAWLAGQGAGQAGSQFVLPKATSACNQNPNDVCCRSCNAVELGGAPPGCVATSQDPQCTQGGLYHTDVSDSLNLRCWDQKRRFGVDFLNGVGRYIEGLTSLTVHDFQGNVVPNPLYMDLSGANAGRARPQSLVFLAGVVGVPWQDIATDDTLGDPNDLKFLTAAEITNQNRWPVILGDPYNYVLPTDSLMVEAPFPRTDPRLALPQAHPLLSGVNLVPETGPLRGNPINGNEYVPPNVNDLQYSCIFPLAQPKPCAGAAGCDCSNTDQGTGKPLCNGNDQVFAKAYPGLRHLEVLKGIGEAVPGVNNAIVASICPKIVDKANPAYGYNPAVASIIDRLREQLGAKCLPRPLGVESDGRLPCAIVEATYSPGQCTCDPNAARADLFGGAHEPLAGPVQARLQSNALCGGNTGRACDDYCLCEILPAAGQAREACLNDPAAENAGNQFGYCYIDQNMVDNQQASPELLAKCPAAQKQTLRFIGQNTPARGSDVFLTCPGSPSTGRP